MCSLCYPEDFFSGLHKVMGDHASRDSTSAGASPATWPRPNWFVFLIYNFIVILFCNINIFCNFAVNQYSYGDAGGC